MRQTQTNRQLRGSLLVLVLLTVACTSDEKRSEPSVESSPAAPSSSGAPHLTDVTGASARTCAVTLGSPFEPPPGVSPDALPGAATSYGNDRLWVGGLAPKGVIESDFAEKGGTARWKFGWWRAVGGRLTVTGRRLDAPAPPLRSEIASGGYGRTGFQPSGVYFPTEGCWEVTGSVGGTTLTFVTLVTKRGA
jgi:hypothetical protein